MNHPQAKAAAKGLVVFAMLAGGVLLGGCRGEFAERPCPRDNASAGGKTEVVLLGTLHGRHRQARHYTSGRLRDILIALRPDAILHELPRDQWDSDQGRPLLRSEAYPEGWAGDQAAQTMGIPQHPFDRPDRQDFFRESRYFERERKSYPVFIAACRSASEGEPGAPTTRLARLFLSTVQAQADLSATTARQINNPAYDALIRTKQELRQALAAMLLDRPETAEALADLRFFGDAWQQRNRIMADRIEAIARDYPGGRLVVLTGNEHRYILGDLLRAGDKVRLVEFWQVDAAATPADR